MFKLTISLKGKITTTETVRGAHQAQARANQIREMLPAYNITIKPL